MTYFKGISIMLCSMPIYKEFRADHGFVYHIWDQQKQTPIFSGRLTKVN